MKKFLSILPVIIICSLTFSQVNYNHALELLLKQNKRAEATKILKELESSSTDGINASLAIALVEAGNEHYDNAYNQLQKVLSTTDNPYPYIYAFWSSGAFNVKNNDKQLLNYLEKLLKDPKAPSTIKAMAAGNLATAEYNSNNIKQCKELYDTYGEIGNWSTVGVFENVSGSGFNKDFGALSHPEQSFIFKNNKGADIKWFAMDHNLGHWYDFEYHYDITNALIYAQTFVKNNADQKAVLKVGVSGSFKIWINDYLVASENEERNTNMDVFNYVVNLKSGNNRILIQMGSSEIDNNNFMVRITDVNDKLIPGLTSVSENVPYTKETPYEVKKLPFFAEEFFENRLAKNPNSFIDLMMLISVYNQNDKKIEARRIAQQLKKSYPNSTLVAERIIESYSRDNNNTDLTRELESIKSNDPESLYGIDLSFNDAMNKEDYKEAWDLLDKREALYGLNKSIINNRIKIHAKKKEYEELFKLLSQAYQKYPDDDGFVTMQYLITYNTTKDPKKAASVLKTYLDEHFDDGLYNMLANNYLQSGKKDEAFKMFRKYVEYFSFATNKYVTISDEYFDAHDYDNAIEWIDKALQRAPYIGRYHYVKGKIQEAQGKKSQAMASMQNAIRYNPGNFEARKKIRELQGKKDLFESFKKNNIEALIKAAPKASEYPNDNSIYLLEDMQQVGYPENGASEEKFEMLVKIFNQAGIDRWKETTIPYNYYTEKLNIEKAELYKKDGTKVQSEANDNELVFSSLEVGDVIHILYRKEVIYYGKLAEHFWEEFSFNGGLPVKECRYSLIVPQNKNFTYRMYNSDLKPKVQEIDDYKIYIWEKENIASINPEPYMPAYSDIEERLVVTSIPDWSYVSNWYRDVSSVKTKADFEIKEKVKELLTGKEKYSELQKARLIYDFIEENFSYSNIPFLHSALTPQRASRTLQTKLGDCKDLSTLFVAMCQEAGLDATLVLVDTRDNGDKNLDLPTIGFNHCIAQLKVDNKSYLVELTNKYLPFSTMNSELLNANGLYIPKENESASQSSLVKLNSVNRPKNTIDRFTTISFSGNNLSVERKAIRSGSEASITREAYKDKGEEDKRKDLSESLAGEFNKKITLKDIKITNVDNLADTLVFKSSFVVENFTSELLGMHIFKLPWSDSYSTLDFISLDKRVYPFILWRFSSTPYDKEIMTVQIPAGKKLAEIPKDISFSCPSMNYSLKFQVKPDKLVVTREVKYLTENIAPSEYAAFKEFITKMNEADTKQYGLK